MTFLEITINNFVKHLISMPNLKNDVEVKHLKMGYRKKQSFALAYLCFWKPKVWNPNHRSVSKESAERALIYNYDARAKKERDLIS